MSSKFIKEKTLSQQIPINTQAKYVAIDFETADYYPDSACSIGMVKIEQGQITKHFYKIIKPPRKKIVFTYIHGLTWQDMQYQPDFASLWPEISAFLVGADFFIAHNAPFDSKVLKTCCLTHNLAIPETGFLCTLKKARQLLKLPSYSLNNLCRFLNINFQHHHALEDAIAAAKLWLYLLGYEQSLGK